MESTFRQFTTTDYREITGLIQALYAEDPDGEPISVEKIKSTFKRFLSYPESGTILVFQLGEKIIGYALIVQYWSNEYGGNILVLDELYIKTEFRSLGIGTKFIGYLKENKPFNMVAMELEVAPYNIRANKLYTELGFELNANQKLIFK